MTSDPLLEGLPEAIPADPARNLAEIHRELWSLEDHVRREDLDDSEIVEGKRRIDELNERRQDHIAAIDQALVPEDPTRGQVRYTQTPGEITDRAVILALKRQKSRELHGDPRVPESKQNVCREQEERFDSWRNYLLDCLRDQVEDIEEGQATFPPRSEFKYYNDADLNQAVTPAQAAG